MQRHIILLIKESSRKKKSMRSRSPHSMYTGGESHVICPEACSMYVLRYYLGRLTRCTTMPWPSAAAAEFFSSLLGSAACPWLSTWLRRRTVFHSLLFKAILGAVRMYCLAGAIGVSGLHGGRRALLVAVAMTGVTHHGLSNSSVF